MRSKGYSMFEIISVITLIMILGAITFANGRKATTNIKDNEGTLILESIAEKNRAISLREDTFPSFPSDMATVLTNSSSKYTFTTSPSSDSSTISINQINSTKIILTVLTGTKCWIMVDENDGTPKFGLKPNSTTCPSSSVPYQLILSTDLKNPSEVSY